MNNKISNHRGTETQRFKFSTPPCLRASVVKILSLSLSLSSVVFASNSIDQDLKTELKNLSDLRATIAAEKPELAKETNRIASELSTKRQEVKLIEIDRSESHHQLESLAGRITQLESEFIYIDNLLFDYRKQLESQLPPAVVEAKRSELLEADTSVEARLNLIENAIGQFDETCGIVDYKGEALDENGAAIQGTFLQAGSILWFISNDRKTGGLTFENRNLRPELVPGTADLKELTALASGKPAAPRFDPTEGSAIALDKASDTWIGHIRKGGFWVYPILTLAIMATMASLGKWLQLAQIKELRPEVIRNVLDALKEEDRLQAETALEKVRHPSKALLQRGIELSNRASGDIEEGMYEKFLEAEPALQRGLSFIAITSATAPLLGLLGTVTGMIYTFRLINVFGTGDAKSLASGISEALVTTEMGLIVAIPALIMHALLSRRVQGIRTSMELSSLAFVNGLEKKVAS